MTTKFMTDRLDELKEECLETVLSLVRELSDTRFAEVTGGGS